jgi:hypothetical protein
LDVLATPHWSSVRLESLQRRSGQPVSTGHSRRA